MSWKVPTYLASALFSLFVLLNFIRPDGTLAMLLVMLFIGLGVATALSVTVAVIGNIRRR